MEIEINGFRCYKSATYKFNDREIILIKGPSGMGKSTIFSAIAWVLYGSIKHIYNHANPNNKCSVRLTLSDLEIIRSKKPELLKVSYRNHYTETKSKKDEWLVVDDKVAQSFINEKMGGDKNLWQVCSYVVQGLRSDLLIASNPEKLDLLTQLAFHNPENSPDTYLDKIDSQLSSFRELLIRKSDRLQNEKLKYQNEKEHTFLNFDLFILFENRSILSDEYNQLIKEKEIIQQKINEQHRLTGQIKSITDTKISLSFQVDKLLITHFEKEKEYIENLELEHQKLSMDPLIIHKDMIESGKRSYQEIGELKSLISKTKIPTNEDIKEENISALVAIENTIREGKLITSKFSIDYLTEAIEQEIKNIDIQLEQAPIINTIISFRNIHKEWTDCQNYIKSLMDSNFEMTNDLKDSESFRFDFVPKSEFGTNSKQNDSESKRFEFVPNSENQSEFLKEKIEEFKTIIRSMEESQKLLL